MLPFGQLVKDAQEVDAREKIAPAVGHVGADLQTLGRQLWLIANHARRKIQNSDAAIGRESHEKRNQKRLLIWLISVYLFLAPM